MPNFIQSVLTATILVIFFVASVFGVYFIFGEIQTSDRTVLLIEIAKTLLQIAFIVIVGGVVSILFKSFETRLKGEKYLHDYKVDFLERLHSTYNAIKACRRSLRASGLSNRYGSLPKSMSEDQAYFYKEQMISLTEHQLNLEVLKKDIESFRGAFSNASQISSSLDAMEKYVRSITKDYEKKWVHLQRDMPNQQVIQFKHLIDFTGRYTDSEFKTNFAEEYDQAVKLIRHDLMPLKSIGQAT